MARGTYKCTTTFVDDDGTTHLTFNYKLVIAKDFLEGGKGQALDDTRARCEAGGPDSGG